MIILEPSAGIKKDTKLNFDVISNLLTSLLEYNHKRKINLYVKIHKSKTAGASFCTPIEGNEYLINLDMSNKKKRYVFGTILHEIRHCIQKEVFKFWPVERSMKTWKDYYFSKEEIDARKIEALTTQFIKSYDAFMNLNELFTKKQLNKLG